ncbi:hypothetical protein MNBD_NITROSPINAE03-1614 [hydrothermal vent metagenome]|uniref:Flagellar assembly protein T N-terminal domain-containing protein n=1 Tax=hydrothermal vent metagenome TaxID=652676 RepID=A0A3B1CJZ7_9ZZZZ
MRIIFFLILTLALSYLEAWPAEQEFITVPVDATVKVTEENYFAAKEKAVAKAFGLAVYRAAVSVIPPDDLEQNEEMIQERLVSKGEDFVSSYKFLDEITDHASGELTARLQVTLFLNPIRTALINGGARVRKRDLPKLVIIIKEQNADFMSESNFMLLSSLTEEILVRNFRQRGFLVADRNDARKAKLDKAVLQAINGDSDATAQVGRALEADLIILGETDVNVTPAEEGERVDVTISVTLRKMPDGASIVNKVEKGGGVYKKVLSGSVETIQSATRIIARDLAIAVMAKWIDLKESFNG